MAKCMNCGEGLCVCPKGQGKPKVWQPPQVDPATIPDEHWFVRRALRRWINARHESGRLDHGKSIKDLIVDEFMTDGASPQHPDFHRLEDYLERDRR